MEPLMESLALQTLALEVSDDHLHLTISPADGRIGRLELEAADLDAFIRKLTECRSRMLPVHPAEPPADPDRLYHNDNLLVDVRACETLPAIQIAMQHPGLGWTVTTLSRDQAEDLQSAIDFALQDIPRDSVPRTGQA
jgi:hypothetical protein